MNTTYVIDSNVLIEAHRRYYARPICPGFWHSLVEQHKAGRIISVSHVKDEIERNKDDLFEWIKSSTPSGFFVKANDKRVILNFTNMMKWVQDNPQFTLAAKDEFSQAADGWLVAYTQANPAHKVVTLEAYSDGIKKRVKIPNLCKQFGVPCTDTFEMLKELNVQFHHKP